MFLPFILILLFRNQWAELISHVINWWSGLPGVRRAASDHGRRPLGPLRPGRRAPPGRLPPAVPGSVPRAGRIRTTAPGRSSAASTPTCSTSASRHYLRVRRRDPPAALRARSHRVPGAHRVRPVAALVVARRPGQLAGGRPGCSPRPPPSAPSAWSAASGHRRCGGSRPRRPCSSTPPSTGTSSGSSSWWPPWSGSPRGDMAGVGWRPPSASASSSSRWRWSPWPWPPSVRGGGARARLRPGRGHLGRCRGRGRDRGGPGRGARSSLARWLTPFAVVCAVVFLPFLVVAPSNTWWFVRFNDLRLQKDSVWGLLGRWASVVGVSNAHVKSVSLVVVVVAMAYAAWARLVPATGTPGPRCGPGHRLGRHRLDGGQQDLEPAVRAVGLRRRRRCPPCRPGSASPSARSSFYDWWFEFSLRLPIAAARLPGSGRRAPSSSASSSSRPWPGGRRGSSGASWPTPVDVRLDRDGRTRPPRELRRRRRRRAPSRRTRRGQAPMVGTGRWPGSAPIPA